MQSERLKTAEVSEAMIEAGAVDNSVPTLVQRLRNLGDWLDSVPNCTVAYLPREAADQLERHYVLLGRLSAAVRQDRAALAMQSERLKGDGEVVLAGLREVEAEMGALLSVPGYNRVKDAIVYLEGLSPPSDGVSRDE